jgi:hypothetical protein
VIPEVTLTRKEKALVEPQVSSVVVTTAQTVEAEDRVTAYGWKALAGSVVGYSMDGFDMLILGLCSPPSKRT